MGKPESVMTVIGPRNNILRFFGTRTTPRKTYYSREVYDINPLGLLQKSHLWRKLLQSQCERLKAEVKREGYRWVFVAPACVDYPELEKFNSEQLAITGEKP